MGDAQEILDDEALTNLAANKDFLKVHEYLKARLSETRATVDDLKVDKLPHIQGRISAFKDIINLFEEIIHDDSRS